MEKRIYISMLFWKDPLGADLKDIKGKPSENPEGSTLRNRNQVVNRDHLGYLLV